jgi:hypothetical protein
MEIYSTTKMTPAQRSALDAFKNVDVFDSMIPPAVVAEFKTFHGQIIQVTIDADGIIRKLTDASGYDYQEASAKSDE